jgi:hypothetical protein
LVTALNPKGNVKSETTFSKCVCPLLYNNIKTAVDAVLLTDLPTVEGVHFTSDHWTSKNNDAYQALTLHYVTDGWEYKKWTVECKNAEGRHTGEAIAALTDSMINSIPGLKNDTYKSMTTDAAANMHKAMAESLVIDSHLRCIDHIINTCVQKALKKKPSAKPYRNARTLQQRRAVPLLRPS